MNFMFTYFAVNATLYIFINNLHLFMSISLTCTCVQIPACDSERHSITQHSTIKVVKNTTRCTPRFCFGTRIVFSIYQWSSFSHRKYFNPHSFCRYWLLIKILIVLFQN
jgi:hypothetical protein